MPQRVSRQWIVENSDKDEGLGVVPIPREKQDGFATHVNYMPDCPHLDETCSCDEDDTVMWELESYEA